ncbi:MAG: UbiX family flavin prenyltransferase [Pirellulaceae bacterium]
MNRHTTRPPFVVGITGASGAVYAQRLLQALLELGHRVYVTISPAGQTVLKQELAVDVDLQRFVPASLQLAVSDDCLGRLVYHHYADYFSPAASGSARTSGMVICPCSGGTLSAVAHGTSTNLIQRAADVHLKERRRLIVVPRETPLSLIHLENMRRVCEAGAIVLPASPGWYHGVKSVRDLVDFIVARILDHLDVEHQLSGRWSSGQAEGS